MQLANHQSTFTHCHHHPCPTTNNFSPCRRTSTRAMCTASWLSSGVPSRGEGRALRVPPSTLLLGCERAMPLQQENAPLRAGRWSCRRCWWQVVAVEVVLLLLLLLLLLLHPSYPARHGILC